ncbi:acriflavin resistance protein [Anaerobacillus arseniciselenatis]|uniref:Acriflavin resistance protein n=1 Tax=Anaerobacillus arseniciselenatis TaxID=85682 RepID=A0A1S2LID4_9BACI|nr:efflux RND transporter permease subunit [Anaerobacillus arseniciselenatis]OIJ12288.1 acriflavin resistance protein [Anaerobacillus arseniciselenatis]
MQLLRFIIGRKILVTLMVVFIFIVGIFAANKLDRELFPAISFDGAQIYASAGQMTTLDVEEQVTKPIEQVLQNINGIKSIDSSSSVGVSSIIVMAEEGLGEEVYTEIESTMRGFENDLSGVDFISTFQFSTEQPYEFYMTITNGSNAEMSQFAKKTLKSRLEALPEVRTVSLNGFEEKEVIVELNLQKLQENGLTQQQVIQIIQQSNIDTSVATLEEEEGKPTVRWTTSFNELDDIKNLQIPSAQGIVELNEIAKVFEEKNTSTSIGWQNGDRDFIFVQIGRANGTTQIEMAESVRAEIEKIRAEGLVNGFQLNELVAQADYVTDALEGVSTNVLIGGLLALVILILFLRNLRATMIIALSIPLSILLTFTGMWLFDHSFNILTLIGLGLGIGMMVDSSIVILESIYRKKEQGLQNLEAVLQGVKEVATAVFASMLTTIVVFVPIGLLGGEMGQFMVILSLIVVVTLVSSVIVAFTLIPTLSENFLKLKKKKRARSEGVIISKYGKLVSWITRKKRNRYSIITIFMVVFISSIMLVTKIPMTVMPDVLNRYAELMVQLESGLTPAEREEVALKINQKISAIDDVESNLINDNIDMFYLLINMTPEEEATVEQRIVNENINRALRDLQDEYPIIGVATADFTGMSYPVVLEIKGNDLEQLSEIASNVISEMTSVEGLVGITSSANRKLNEELIELKTDQMKEDGVTALQVFGQFQEWSSRIPVGEIRLSDTASSIFVTTNIDINDKSSFLEQEIPTMGGMQKLSTYIDLMPTEVPSEIKRKDGERMITVMADLEDRDLGSVNRDIEELLSDFNVPAGYTIGVGGSLQEQQEAQQEMLMILGIAIFLVYVVMAVQFNSLIHPFIVMSIIPMTATGALLGLLITQSELSVLSGMGMVFLIGIVLNNAILLIDRTKQLRLEGYDVKDAVVEAGKNRIRPIFMTTLTTAGGMFPLAIASGAASNYQSPLAIVIISGLLFATLITLLLIPSVYMLFEDIKRGLQSLVSPTRRGQKRKMSVSSGIIEK